MVDNTFRRRYAESPYEASVVTALELLFTSHINTRDVNRRL